MKSDERATDAVQEQVSTLGTRGDMNSRKEQAGYECEAWPRRYMTRVEVTEEATSCHWREIRRKYDRRSNGTRD